MARLFGISVNGNVTFAYALTFHSTSVWVLEGDYYHVTWATEYPYRYCLLGRKYRSIFCHDTYHAMLCKLNSHDFQ